MVSSKYHTSCPVSQTLLVPIYRIVPCDLQVLVATSLDDQPDEVILHPTRSHDPVPGPNQPQGDFEIPA